MPNTQFFETSSFWTNESISIPLDKVLDLQERPSVPWGKIDQVRVYIIAPHPLIDWWELLLIHLEDGKKLSDQSGIRIRSW